jgi:hypothetical protein
VAPEPLIGVLADDGFEAGEGRRLPTAKAPGGDEDAGAGIVGGLETLEAFQSDQAVWFALWAAGNQASDWKQPAMMVARSAELVSGWRGQDCS